MRASWLTDRLTTGRVLVGLLVLANVGLAIGLLRSSQRTSALERRVEGDRPPRAAVGTDPPARTARRSESLRPADLGLAPRTASDEPERPVLAGSPRPPDDPEDAFDRLVGLVNPSPTQERVMREAFDKHHPEALAAFHRGDLEAKQAAWWKYCDEVASVLDAPSLQKLGCKKTAPPPPNPNELVLPEAPPGDLEARPAPVEPPRPTTVP